MLRRYFDSIEYRLKRPFFQDRLLENVMRSDVRRGSRKALIIYKSLTFWIHPTSCIQVAHTNIHRVRMIAEELSNAGYWVDLIDFTGSPEDIVADYELVIGIDRLFNTIAEKAKSTCLCIRLTAGMEPRRFNQAVAQRLEEITLRRGVVLDNVRRTAEDAESLKYFQLADCLFCLGNRFTISTYSNYFPKPIVAFPNHGYSHLAFLPKRDIKKARHNFLFFSGAGKVFLGLDLVLEVFARRPDIHLYICSDFRKERDFEAAFEKEIYHTPNIHMLGRVVIGHKKFREVVQNCNFVISPQCGGASHGSVVVCMHHGLIPITTKEAGIDMENCGILLSDHSITAIESALDTIESQSDEWISGKSKETYETALRDYSNDVFRRQFNTLLSRMSAS